LALYAECTKDNCAHRTARALNPTA
jgi:hypothetical protein